MNWLRALLHSMLLLFALGFCNGATADELKDVSQLASQGQLGQALDKINAYLTTHPKDVAGQFLKGVILAEQNKLAEAIRIFSAITEKHPELPEPYNNLAVLYAEQGQYDKARQSLEKAIKTHPSYATAHENLGDIYAKMASDAYDKALQLDRSNARAQTKLAMVKELFSKGGVTPPATSSQPPDDSAKGSTIPSPVADTAKAAENKTRPVPAMEVKGPKPTEKPAAKEEPEADPRQAVMEAVNGWAKAWSAKDIDGYLASYADDFKTPNGESRSEWQNMRKERLRKPASIQVEVLNPKISVEGDHATISFRQSYRSGDNSMRTSKTLHLRKTGGRWLITQEIAGH